MNPIPMLRELLDANPFKPFALCLSDGRRLPVYHPDFLTISPKGRIFWEGQTEEQFAMAMPFTSRALKTCPRGAASVQRKGAM